MTVDTAATSSPESFPEAPDSDARLTRLHDALKQLRAKSTATVPLASIAPIAGVSPVASNDALAPAWMEPPAPKAPPPASSDAAVMSIEAADAPYAPPGEEAAAVQAAPEPQRPPLKLGPSPPAAATIDSRASAPRLAPAAEAGEREPPPFNPESWFSSASLRQYRRLAGNIASHIPSGDPAAIGLAVLSCRHAAEQLAARLALCLAERQEGEVLLVEPAGPRLAFAGDARRAGLVDVVVGRAHWADAVSPTEMETLALIGFGSTAAPEDAPLNDQWRTALIELKRRYRYIVSAARPAESFPSDAWLAAIDGVYLAVSLGDAPRTLAAEYHSQLKTLGAQLLGCIAIK